MYILNALAGFLVGALSGFTMAWAAPPWVWGNIYALRILYGLVGGGVLGGLIGSLTLGDPNKAAGATNHGFLVAAIFGVIGGGLGADKAAILFTLLEPLHIPSPFH